MVSKLQFSVFSLQIFKPVDGDIGHVRQVVLDFGKFCLDFHQQFISLILIIFKDSLHLDFQQLEDIIPGYLAMEGIFHHALAIYFGGEELVLERLQLGIDECHYLVLVLALLELALLVDALFDEDAFQG